jgi:parallel beta-helix repeat protein
VTTSRARQGGIPIGQGEETTFFVAPSGSSAWSGRLAAANAQQNDGPFATLIQARNAVRELKVREKGLKAPITVMVRGGKYHLSETLELTESDSGTRECPITWRAYPDETPVLSGGRVVSGWRPFKGDILQCDLPEAMGGKWRFRQLFFNGRRQTRARYPKLDPENPVHGGWANAEDPAGEGSPVAFRYKPSTFPRRWAKPTEAEVFLLSGMGLTDTLPIKTIDEERYVITLTGPVKDHAAMPYVSYPNLRISIDSGYRFYVENVLEELDQPGEWCLDGEDGRLYFWAPEPIEDGSVVAPVLDSLIALRGASHISVSGFTLTETTAGDSMHRGGHEGYGAMLPMAGQRYCGEALHMTGAEHCRIENNHFDAVGGNAIYVEGYNERNVIRGNEIGYAGAMGICLIGSQYSNPRVSRRYPIYNEVTDNHVHHCGVFDKYVAGVFLGLSQSNVIGHNRIEYMPHHGINLGNSGFGRNIVEYNEIRNVGRESCDKGAINMWMEDPYGLVERQAERSGHVIRYNLIADFESQRLEQGTLKPCNPAFGIYLDNYTSNSFVYGNIVVRSGSVGIYLQGGKNNIVENNIVVDSLCATHMGGWWQPQMEGFMTGNHFTRNIFYNTDDSPKVIHRHIGFTTEPLSDAIGVSDYNVFFSAGGAGFAIRESSSPLSDMEESKRTYPLWPKYEEIPLEEWRRMGFDTHSVVADPLFVDPKNDDFRLKPDSPALKLGFQPIDQSKIGPRERPKHSPR